MAHPDSLVSHPDYSDDGSSAAPARLTRQVFLATFQFSQGDVGVQTLLFHYFKLRHPTLQLTDSASTALSQSCEQPAATIRFNTQRHVPVRGRHPTVRESIELMLDDAAHVFAGSAPLEASVLVPQLAHAIVKQDVRYLERSNGRRYVADPTGHTNPYKDRWRSDLCYFGLLGHTTGLADFDALFAEIAAYWRAEEHPIETPGLADAYRLVTLYNQHHPEHPATL